MTEAEKRAAVLAICRRCVGIKEKPSNNVIFNTLFYGREVFDGDRPGAHYEWCGTSVSEIFIEAGFGLGTIDFLRGYASVITAIKMINEGHRVWGQVIPLAKAQSGDIFMIDFDRNGRYDHTGIIESVAGNHLRTFEGNTSGSHMGSQSNGGEYCYKDRYADRAGIICIRPNAYDREFVKSKTQLFPAQNIAA